MFVKAVSRRLDYLAEQEPADISRHLINNFLQRFLNKVMMTQSRQTNLNKLQNPLWDSSHVDILRWDYSLDGRNCDFLGNICSLHIHICLYIHSYKKRFYIRRNMLKSPCQSFYLLKRIFDH